MTGPSLGHVCLCLGDVYEGLVPRVCARVLFFFFLVWCGIVFEYNHTQGKRVGIVLGLDACVCAFLWFLVHVICMLSVAVVCWTVWRGDMDAFFCW